MDMEKELVIIAGIWCISYIIGSFTLLNNQSISQFTVLDEYVIR